MTNTLLSKKMDTCRGKHQPVAVLFYLAVSTFLLVKAVAESHVSASTNSQTRDLLMTGENPIGQDAYRCTAYPVTDLEAYIYKLEAVANASTVHHILLYGCDGETSSSILLWNCKEMCQSGRATILFAWAKNAPPTIFPKGVALRIGQKTSVRAIILQIHYSKSFSADEPLDHSGVRIYTTQEKQPYVAGIFLLTASAFTIPPGNPFYPVDISCRFSKEKSMFPIFYRTHSHSHGTVITGYQYNDSYHEIGKGNPQWPQAFYPVKDKIEVKQGDYLTARCTFDSLSEGLNVSEGPTGTDEMCNFYIMFFTDSSVQDPYGECIGNNVPELTGDNLPLDVSITLPPNHALEEEARWHYHHGEMNKVAYSNEASKKQNVVKDDFRTLGFIAQKIKARILQSSLSTQDSQEKDGSRFKLGADNEDVSPGKSMEIMQYDSEFDEPDSMGRAYEKRQHHEYYDDYAANDLREKGLFDPSPGGAAAEQGLSRNRNKEFETMNQQLQHFPHKNPPRRPAHHHVSNSVSNGGNSDPKGPTLVEHVVDPNVASVDTVTGEAAKAHSQIHFEHALEYNASWPVQKNELGEIGGVATDNNGNVYIFHRGSRTWTSQMFSLDNDFLFQDSPIPEDVIVVLDSQGRLIWKFGAGQYFMPHGIDVDKEGNIWLTDVALHQVLKIPHGESKPSLVLGRRFKHGKDVSSFCQPTDVAVLSSGEFFVSDGYCNGRVLKFSSDGTFIKTWGERGVITGSSPPAGVFDIPHSITVSEENQLVCVADRENGRVQCFDLNGTFKHLIKHPQFGPRLFAIEHCPLHGGILYAVNGPTYSGPRDFSVEGFTLDIKTGYLLEVWNVPQLLKNPHDVCVHPASHSVYVGELDPKTVWKLSRASTSSKPVETANLVSKQNGTMSETKLNKTMALSGKTGDTASTTADSNVTSLAVHGVKDTETTSITPSVIIGCLLVIPVLLLLIIILLVRAHKSGKLKCYGHPKKRVFSLQGILGTSHRGFDPLSTEDSDHDFDQEDSEREEYLAPKKIKSKA